MVNHEPKKERFFLEYFWCLFRSNNSFIYHLFYAFLRQTMIFIHLGHITEHVISRSVINTNFKENWQQFIELSIPRPQTGQGN